MHPLLQVLFILLIAGVALWLLARFPMIDADAKQLIKLFVLAVLAIWVIWVLFSIFAGGRPPVPF